MKLQIERERLLKPLSYVTSVVEKRQTLPILGNVYFEKEGKSLTLIGTDLETEITTRIDDAKGNDGACTITAKKLYDICRTLPEDASIQIEVQGDKAVVKSGRSRFTLQTLPAGEFPRLETADWDIVIEVDQSQLRRLLEKTSFAMAQQDVRYYLNGSLIEIAPGRLRAVATDGHRLAKSDIEIEASVEQTKQAIVPRKAVLELIRLLEGEGNAILEMDSSHLRVKVGTVVFTTKLIDGRFPDYDKVIPDNLTTHLLVDRITFHDILARTAILTNEKFRGVRLALGPGVMTVTAHNPEQEEAVDEMVVDYDGEELEIGFNVGYLMDALRALPTTEVDFGLQDPNSSCTVQAPEQEETLYLVMPMRI